MQNNVYGAELDLKIDKFKSKMKEAQTISKETGKKIADNTKFNVWENGVMTLSNGVQLVKKSEKELNNEIDKTSEITQNTGNEISKSFNKGLKSVKKLTIGFLGARSAFGLFKKYMSEYSSQNEEFAQKMQLTTNVITTALAPAFEFFGNIIQYVVIGLARVVELLFGVNILGKTMDTSLKRASKSAKELNDNLSGLDEISNIDQSASGLSTGIGGQLKAMEDFQKKIAEVDEWFKKHKIDEKILAIKNAVKSVWDWANNHPILTTAFIAGLLALKTGILPSLISMISGSGNTSLLGGFKALLAVSLATWVVDQVNQLDKLEQKVNKITEKLKKESSEKESKASTTTSYMKQFNDYNEQYYKKAQKDYKKAIEDLKKAKKEQEKIATMWTWILEPGDYYDAIDHINEIEKRIGRIKEEQKKLNATYDIGTNRIGQSVQLTDTMQSTLEKANKRAQFINDTTSKWSSNISNANSEANNLNKKMSNGFISLQTNINDTNNTFNSMKKNINNTFDKNYSLKIDISSISSATKSIVSQFNTSLRALGIKLPSYDVGTDYVPRDQIAMIHEGERIVPKKYNNSRYMGNEETNSLLIELNRNVLELANKPSILNVNGKELAKATYSDYQEEGSRRGSNMSIRRL